jgi:hypothetical protein
MGKDIAADRISCKPQKLQAMLARVKIGRGGWHQVGQAGRKTWLPCRAPIVEPSWIGRRHGYQQGGMIGAPNTCLSVDSPEVGPVRARDAIRNRNDNA